MPEDTYAPLFSEICTKVNNAKDKPKKIQVLRQYRTAPFEMFLKSALDPNMFMACMWRCTVPSSVMWSGSANSITDLAKSVP